MLNDQNYIQDIVIFFKTTQGDTSKDCLYSLQKSGNTYGVRQLPSPNSGFPTSDAAFISIVKNAKAYAVNNNMSIIGVRNPCHAEFIGVSKQTQILKSLEVFTAEVCVKGISI